MDADHWLDHYANSHFHWRKVRVDGKIAYVRPQGYVEQLFSLDGDLFAGRADITGRYTFEVRSTLLDAEFRQRLLIAWTALRFKHAMLRATSLRAEQIEGYQGARLSGRCFQILEPTSIEALMEEARKSLVFVSDHFDTIDVPDFLVHTQNATRLFTSSGSLSKLLVLPLQQLPNGHQSLNVMLIMGHDIADGLTGWSRCESFYNLLNQDLDKTLQNVYTQIGTDSTFNNLPPAQEDVYPPVSGSKARRRWFWAISRVLLHKRVPPRSAFPNPLHRSTSLAAPTPLATTYAPILDYTKPALLTTLTVYFGLSPAATLRLHTLCRQAKVSLGSGTFALVALSMMVLHERRFPDVDPLSRLGIHSLMLAFSDGLALPFLPSSLDFAGRFRLLARSAHRQLTVYQKRPRDIKSASELGVRSAQQMLPALYLNTITHANKRAGNDFSPQGELTMRVSESGATCGVSSIGRAPGWMSGGRYELDGRKAFQADLRSQTHNVRVRDKEFLIGAMGNEKQMSFGVMYDANYIDPERVEEWKTLITEIMEPDAEAKL